MNKTIQIIPQINTQLEQFKSSIDVIIQQNNDYFTSIKRYSNKTFDFNTNGKITKEKKNEIDTMIDQLEDIQQRNEIVLQHLDDFNIQMKEMKEIIENTLKKEYLTNQEFIQNKLWQFSGIVMKYYGKENEKIFQILEEVKRQIIEEISLPYNTYIDEKNEQSPKDSLDIYEKKQLQRWTRKKCGEVLFDSEKDDWSRNTSVFDDRVVNRSHLTFVIEEITGNKFGYYFNGTVNTIGSWIKSTGSFQFSLKSNGRLDGMYNFYQKDSCSGLHVFGKSNSSLFCVHGGIWPNKENTKRISQLFENQTHFEYHGYKNVYLSNSHKKSCHHTNFTPKRITVIQMN